MLFNADHESRRTKEEESGGEVAVAAGATGPSNALSDWNTRPETGCK